MDSSVSGGWEREKGDQENMPDIGWGECDGVARLKSFFFVDRNSLAQANYSDSREIVYREILAISTACMRE